MVKNKKTMFMALSALAVVAVAGMAVFSNGSQFQGMLTLPGKTGETRVAGATCIAFVPAELKEKHGVRIGPATVNSLKFKGCQKAKVKKITYQLSGQNAQLQSLKLMKNDQDLTAMLTKDSQMKLAEANLAYNKMLPNQNYTFDLEFQNAIEFTANDYVKLNTNFTQFNADATFNSNMMEVTYVNEDATYQMADYSTEMVTMTYRDKV